MGDFVGQHGCQLAGVGGQGQDAPRDIDIAPGQREGVDLGRIENGHLELGIGLVCRGQEASDDAGHHDLGLPVLIDAAIGRNDARMLAQAQHRIVRVRAFGHDRRGGIVARARHIDAGAHQRGAG
ncbi:hypothetical protein D3C72_2069310 [compost metagenome]